MNNNIRLIAASVAAVGLSWTGLGHAATRTVITRTQTTTDATPPWVGSHEESVGQTIGKVITSPFWLAGNILLLPVRAAEGRPLMPVGEQVTQVRSVTYEQSGTGSASSASMHKHKKHHKHHAAAVGEKSTTISQSQMKRHTGSSTQKSQSVQSSQSTRGGILDHGNSTKQESSSQGSNEKGMNQGEINQGGRDASGTHQGGSSMQPGSQQSPRPTE